MDAQWFSHIEAERRAGNITWAQAGVLRALGRLLACGDHEPSEARLASETGASRATVQRAKARAKALGLLAWDRQWRVDAGLRRELPCAYRAEQPVGPVVRREHQPAARSKCRSIQQQLAALPAVTPALVAMWAARKAGLARSATRYDRACRGAPHAR